MRNTTVFTIIAKNYLPFARTLMQSVKAHHPEFKRFVLLVDDAEGYFVPGDEDFVVDDLAVLDLPEVGMFRFKYNVLELSTAVKPSYMRYLLDRHGDIENLLYLDPDIMLFDQLTPVLDALERQDIVLTPHLTGELDDDKRPSEWEILRAGAYNLGFIGVRRGAQTESFLRWWERKLENDCVVDVANNLFVDQRWIDLVPGMFDGVQILRDSGLNVAYWNLRHRHIHAEDGRYTIDGRPLRFFHFSGFRPDNTETLSHYQNRYTLDNLGAATPIVECYRQAVLDHGYRTCKAWPYTYGSFSDGSVLPDFFRRMARDNLDLQAAVAERYEKRGYDEIRDYFLTYANEPFDDRPSDPVLITRFAHKLYTLRPDVQQAFPHLQGVHRVPFAMWLVHDAAQAYGLGPALVGPVAASLDAMLWGQDPQIVGGRWMMPPQQRALHAQLTDIQELRTGLEAASQRLRWWSHQFEQWRGP